MEINQYTITYIQPAALWRATPDTYTVEMDTYPIQESHTPRLTPHRWGAGTTSTIIVTILKGKHRRAIYTAHLAYNGGSFGCSSSYPITVPSKTENGTQTVAEERLPAGSTVTHHGETRQLLRAGNHFRHR